VSLFNAAALQSLDASLSDDSSIVEVEEDELRRIAGGETQRRCAGLKLASRIVGVATANSADLDDDGVLHSMGEFMRRLSSLRQTALGVIGADKASPDFPLVFNAVTNAMLDVATEEWKWSRLAPGKTRQLPPGVIGKLLAVTIQSQPERFTNELAGGDMANARRLCVLESIPKLYSLANLFDYYQTDSAVMLGRLVRAVVDEAETHTTQMTISTSPSFAVRAILQRMYGISTGLMCEVYKAAAFRDVTTMRSMSDLDRSIVIAQYEHLGGMKYDHILEQHHSVMARMIETANLILKP